MKNIKMWDLLKNKDKRCLQQEDGVFLSYGQVDEFGERLLHVLEERCLIFILCRNSIGAVAGYISFVNHRIVPVLLNEHIEKRMLDSLLSLYRPLYLWGPVERADQMQGQIVFEEYGYCLIKMEYGMLYTIHDELGLLLTTSGSTGSPKFVRQSYENIRINSEQIAEYLELDSSERPITTLPMNYTYGLSIIHSHLLVGATILLTDKRLPQREFWNFFREAKATSFGGVPYTYEMLERLHFRTMVLPSLRCMTQAGGKLSPELHKKFAEYAIENHKKFIVMYGQCEATARMAYLPAKDSLRKYGSMGIAIPGGKFTLTGMDGKEITETGVTGELVYTGPNVTMGYAQTPEELALGDERNGRLETGDMAKQDEEGYYYIVGRKRRFLKVYGNRVNLDELDGILKSQYGNVDCSCAGVDDHVYIFITEETEQTIYEQQEQRTDKNVAEVIRKYIAEKTGIHFTAFEVLVIPEIPKNDAGKIQYKELEKYYGL